jgi:hypothetical protein
MRTIGYLSKFVCSTRPFSNVILSLGAAQVHDWTDVRHDPNVVNGDLLVRVDAHFRDLGEVALVTEVECEPEPTTGGQFASPFRSLGHRLDDGDRAARVEHAPERIGR